MRHLPGRVRAGPAHHALRGGASDRESLSLRRLGRRRQLTSLRDDALAAWWAGVHAADGADLVARYLTEHPRVSADLERTLVVATGKVAVPMAAGVGVGARGFALAPHPAATAFSNPTAVPMPGVELLGGGHPVPDAEGVESSRKILDAVSALGGGDRLLYLVSGGSSALFEVPDPRIEPAELFAAHDELVRSGADIAEINRVRRLLSRTKGGRLAAAAWPAAVLTLAISDVAGDAPAILGSGPTVAPRDAGRDPSRDPSRDGSTDALDVVRRYRLESVLAPAVLETLARPEPCGPANVEGFVVLASAATARADAERTLEARGYRCVSLPVGRLAGDASDAARNLAETVRTLAARGEKLAFALGGETTLRVPAGAGVGGRNQHIAALLALELRDLDGFAAVVAGTDGRDGNSDAAGGLVDAGTAARAQQAGAPLAAAVGSFDTAPALRAAGDALVTGPTATNVEDLVVITIDTVERGTQ